MKPWEGVAAALGGAVLAIAAIYAIPGFGPGGSGEKQTETAEAQPFGVVEADAETLKRADIRVVPLAAGMPSNIRNGYARALDLSGLAAINADYLSARSAEMASAAELSRQKALFAADKSTSARAVEQAQAQEAADAARAKLACRRASLEYGAGLERLGCSALDGLLRDAAAGRAALVRLDFSGDPPAPGMRIAITGEGVEAGGRVLGPATSADPQLQTTGALALVEGPAAARLAVGRVFNARMSFSSASASGVLVPRSAILRVDGGLWAYRAGKNGQFERLELIDARATLEGWIVSQGFRPGDKIVVSGAGTLFALEHAAPAEEEE